MVKVCTSCERSGGIECSLKHNQEAIVFLQEALTRPIDDARLRCLKAYGHLSHSSDEHLPETHPEMAARCRQIRKMLEPCIYKRSNACPPKGCIEEIETFQGELQNKLRGMEHGTRKRKEEDVLAKLEGRVAAEVQDFSDIIVNDVTVNNDGFSPWFGAAVALAVSLVIVPYVFRKP